MVVVSIICSFHPEPYKKIPFLSGGFKYFFMFTPNFADDFQFNFHIFQRGWFNHQLGSHLTQSKNIDGEQKPTHKLSAKKNPPTWRVDRMTSPTRIQVLGPRLQAAQAKATVNEEATKKVPQPLTLFGCFRK